MDQLIRYGRLILVALGVIALFLSALVFYSVFAARQAQQSAEQQAITNAARVAGQIESIQQALAGNELGSAASELLADGLRSDQRLLDAARTAGIDRPLSVQVFDPVLEDLQPGSYPDPDFAVLEMLIEARRTGSSMPEVQVRSDQTAHLVFVQRVEDGDQVQGIVLLRLPVAALIDGIERGEAFDYLGLSQGVGEQRITLWQDGSRPGRDPARAPVADSRFWLEWHRNAPIQTVGLRGATIAGLAGLVLLLIGLGVNLPSLKSALVSRLRSIPVTGTRAAKVRSKKGASPPPVEPLEDSSSDSRSDPEPEQSTEAPQPARKDARAGRQMELDSDRSSDAARPGSDGPTPTSPVAPAEPDDLVLDIEASAHEKRKPESPAQPPPGDPKAQDKSASETPLPPPSPAPLPPEPEEPALELELEPASEQAEPPRAEQEPAEQETGASEQPLDLVDPEGTESSPPAKPEPTSAAPVPAKAPKPTRPAKKAQPKSEPETVRSLPVDARLFNDAGILGRFESGLDGRSATLISQMIAAAAAERGIERIAVGRDARLHGAILLSAVVQGLRAGGINVVELGAVPVPVLDFAALEMADQAGIMVTGAHLPADWNGLRLMLRGELLDGAELRSLAERAPSESGAGAAGEVSEQSVIDRYCEAVAARVQLERPLKVVVDCANGVTGLVLPRLLNSIGVDVIPLYADVDGAFPNHDPDPSRTEHLEDLRLCVRNFRADLGFAIGGDGDRLVMVGPDSEIIWPDRLMMLLARDLLARQPGARVIQDAMCSPRLARFVTELGGQSAVADLGAAAVSRSLRKTGAALGGTFAGQLTLADDWNGTSDALFVACRVLEILAADTRDVSDLLAELPNWFSRPPVFLATRPASPDKLLDRLLQTADVSDAEVGSENGFTIDDGKAWTRICRSADGSGLVIRFEGDDEAAVASLTTLVRHLLSAVDERLKLPA